MTATTPPDPTQNQWKHPNDIFLAQIQGRLDCEHCQHWHMVLRPWCRRYDLSPSTVEEYCADFQLPLDDE